MQVGVRRVRRAGGAPTGQGTSGEMPALDGIRAFAALSVVFNHSFELWAPQKLVFGLDITTQWNYTQSGVHLFFVLSGFLLFLPFARAMLQRRALPSTRRFYARRALRILPTYWVCVLVLVLVQLPQFLSAAGAWDVVAHVFLLHDNFPDFNRAIEGPFWTLALEAQFYLLLPLIAWCIARVVGATRSVTRLAFGVASVLVAALCLRAVDALGQSRLGSLHGFAYGVVFWATHVTQGEQGKFLEVFALGMLCAVCYLVVVEERRVSAAVVRWIGLALLLFSVLAYASLGELMRTHFFIVPSTGALAATGNPLDFFGPLLSGLDYAAFMLAVLLLGGPVAGLFAWAPLRFIGIMSYSLYLWHLPFVHGIMPFTQPLSWPWRVVVAFAVAYVSYLLLERPFLVSRRRLTQRAPSPAAGMSAARAEPTAT